MRINLPLLPRSWNKLGAQCWWACIYFLSHFFIPQFSLMNANEINEIFGYWKMRVWLCVIYLCSTCKHPSRAFFFYILTATKFRISPNNNRFGRSDILKNDDTCICEQVIIDLMATKYSGERFAAATKSEGNRRKTKNQLSRSHT